jgi:hypothetical protein
VTVRSLLAAAAGLCMALPLPAQEPARLQVERGSAFSPSALPSPNQQLADTIAEHLRQSGQLHHYQVDVICRDGTAELSGSVADQPQREEAVRLAQGVPGVERVLDRLTIGAPITAVRAVLNQGPELAPPPGRVLDGMPPGVAAEPVPVGVAPTPGAYDLNPPKLPPYAWPTYAPYNNYSRVAYPEAYPYQSWPFIGPMYPFPKVPLGWRAVKLEWEDGHWWYSKVATKHDWWRVRYW